MEKVLLWLYIVNVTLVIIHEMDSAYWKEWELFKMKPLFKSIREPEIAGFLIVHIPLLIPFLYGIIEVYKMSKFGLILSFILGVIGIGAFIIHFIFLRKGYQQFNTFVSKLILIILLTSSLIQLIIATILYLKIT